MDLKLFYYFSIFNVFDNELKKLKTKKFKIGKESHLNFV